jgi:hypothetical protein
MALPCVLWFRRLGPIFGAAGRGFDEAIFEEGSVMSDDQRAKGPTPVLRTRPATMLTAIGLCVFIMVMQLLPQFSDGGLNRISSATTTTTAATVAR